VRDGVCVAALHALCAARQVLDGRSPSIKKAYRACGANLVYTRAAVILLRAGNSALVAEVIAGEVPLLSAAKEVAGRVRLAELFCQSSPEDRAAFTVAVVNDYRLEQCRREIAEKQVFAFDQ
jgi:hypothetical protein